MLEIAKSMTGVTGYIESRPGGRSENQDFAGVAQTSLGTMVVVCDGMGGMQGGSTASRLAVQTMLEYVKGANGSQDPVEVMKNAIFKSNSVVYTESQDKAELHGMGTTLTAVLFTDRCAIAAFVGDSRIYQLRGGKKVFRTFDHSMVFEMVKQKVITEEQARLSSQSNIILKALGIKADVEPEIFTLPYRPGDRFVLCSDGFWGTMPEPELIAMLSDDKGLDIILQKMCDYIDTLGRKKGSEYDNLTAALVQVSQPSKMRPRRSPWSLAAWILGVLALIAVTVTLTLKFT